MTKLCTAPGCSGHHLAYGLCSYHYYRMKRGAIDPGVIPVPQATKRAEKTIDASGYVVIKVNKKVVREHQVIVEKALGRSLKFPEQVHHIDNNPENNNPDNLVLCPTRQYHALLHTRQKAFNASGNADWRRCYFCKTYDDPANLVCRPDGKGHYHRVGSNRCVVKTKRTNA